MKASLQEFQHRFALPVIALCIEVIDVAIVTDIIDNNSFTVSFIDIGATVLEILAFL